MIPSIKKFHRVLTAFILWGCFAFFPVYSASFILPIDAIEASGSMEAEEFKDTYPGIALDGGYLADFGYYIRYNHENLFYFFGPLEDLEEAQVELKRLETILLRAVEERPSLSTATIDIIQFDRNGLANLGDGSGDGGDGNRPFGGSSDKKGEAGEGSGGPLMKIAGLGGSDQDVPGQGNNSDPGEGTGDQDSQQQGEGQEMSDISGAMGSLGTGQGSQNQQGQQGQQVAQNRQGSQQQMGSQNSQSQSQSQSPSQSQSQSNSRNMPSQSSPGGGSGPPGSPDQQQQGGGGPPPVNIFEILKRIFGG